MSQCIIQGQTIPREVLGELQEIRGGHRDGTMLRGLLDERGYVLVRGVLDDGEVRSARREVFGRLEQAGEIRPPAIDGIATGESRRRERFPDLNDYWQSVSEGPALRQVTHGPRLRELMTTILDDPARPHDLIYLRPAAVGRATRLHFDFPFFADGGLQTILTAWIPLGDVSTDDGPLVIVAGSHRFTDLIDPLRRHDFQDDRSNDSVQRAAYEQQNMLHPIELARQRRTQLLTTDFRAGDLLVFSMFTMHGSLDNCSPLGCVRLSCDVRYQSHSAPADDERYFGPNPIGSKGGGYGDMKGARPLTDAWT